MSDRVSAPLQWRPMRAADLAAVGGLSARIHPHFPERPEVLAEKFRLFPRGCFVLDSAGARICGYCFSHPWMVGPPPALDVLLGALPEQPNAYFIHDLALDPSVQSKGLAVALMPELVAIARGIPVTQIALVAVGGSEPFWTRTGFRRTEDASVQAKARAKYGEQAVPMERDVTSDQSAAWAVR